MGIQQSIASRQFFGSHSDFSSFTFCLLLLPLIANPLLIVIFLTFSPLQMTFTKSFIVRNKKKFFFWNQFKRFYENKKFHVQKISLLSFLKMTYICSVLQDISSFIFTFLSPKSDKNNNNNFFMISPMANFLMLPQNLMLPIRKERSYFSFICAKSNKEKNAQWKCSFHESRVL